MPAEGPRPFEVIEQGVNSSIGEALATCVKNAARWDALWEQHGSQAVARSTPPRVDFGSQMVAVMTLGTRPSAGYELKISRLFVERGTLIVEATEIKPDPNLRQAQVLTAPYTSLRTARFEGPVEFRLR